MFGRCLILRDARIHYYFPKTQQPQSKGAHDSLASAIWQSSWMEPEPWEVEWEVKEKGEEPERRKGEKLGKGSLGSDPKYNVCLLYF